MLKKVAFASVIGLGIFIHLDESKKYLSKYCPIIPMKKETTGKKAEKAKKIINDIDIWHDK